MKDFVKQIKKSIPEPIKKFYRRIYDFYKWDDYYQKSWGQEGEDLILLRFFGEKRDGFYVDIGAHHPKRFSNTNYFYQRGWKGINIDAMPGSMRQFDKHRKRDINIEKPISDSNQVLTYYAFNETALNGFSRELSEQRNGTGDWKLKFTKDIETITLEEILDTNLPAGQHIDFLTIDVEGFDFEVLKSNNFEKYKPTVILIEILESGLEDIENSEISKLLKKHNYSVYAKTINTVFFVSKLLPVGSS